ncbi:MAG: hypothetical protein ACPL1Y_03650 [Thermoplasmata archaeon]
MDNEQKTNVKFETVKAEKISFGKNNFIEIARKKATTSDGNVNEFITLSRGFVTRDGSERYKNAVTIPDDPDIKNQIAEKIKTV